MKKTSEKVFGEGDLALEETPVVAETVVVAQEVNTDPTSFVTDCFGNEFVVVGGVSVRL